MATRMKAIGLRSPALQLFGVQSKMHSGRLMMVMIAPNPATVRTGSSGSTSPGAMTTSKLAAYSRSAGLTDRQWKAALDAYGLTTVDGGPAQWICCSRLGVMWENISLASGRAQWNVLSVGHRASILIRQTGAFVNIPPFSSFPVSRYFFQPATAGSVNEGQWSQSGTGVIWRDPERLRDVADRGRILKCLNSEHFHGPMKCKINSRTSI